MTDPNFQTYNYLADLAEGQEGRVLVRYTRLPISRVSGEITSKKSAETEEKPVVLVTIPTAGIFQERAVKEFLDKNKEDSTRAVAVDVERCFLVKPSTIWDIDKQGDAGLVIPYDEMNPPLKLTFEKIVTSFSKTFCRVEGFAPKQFKKAVMSAFGDTTKYLLPNSSTKDSRDCFSFPYPVLPENISTTKEKVMAALAPLNAKTKADFTFNIEPDSRAPIIGHLEWNRGYQPEILQHLKWLETQRGAACLSPKNVLG